MIWARNTWTEMMVRRTRSLNCRWRQNEVRRSRYSNDQKFEATINKGMMGDYSMRIGDNSRLVRIRRVQ
jgi:Txe/YoeB family toxin of Txe-Axe toxin-antitoxin module